MTDSPQPPSHPPAKRKAAKPRRVTEWVLFIIAVIVSAMAIRSIVIFMQPPVYHDVPLSTRAADEPGQLQGDAVGLPTDPAALEQLLAQPGTQATDEEPAALPPPPNGTNLMRYRIVEENFVQHVSIWSFADSKVDAVSSYYQQAISERGFAQSHDRKQLDRQVISSTYRQDGRVLTVRCRQAGAVVRVVLQLRYTIAP